VKNIIAAFLLILTLAACAHKPETRTLPKQFLGYWAPFSRTAGNIALNIYEDGRIDQLAEKDRSIIESGRYLFVASPHPDTVYIVTKFPKVSSCERLTLERNPPLSEGWTFLEVDQYGYLYPPMAEETFITQCKESEQGRPSIMGGATYSRSPPIY